MASELCSYLGTNDKAERNILSSTDAPKPENVPMFCSSIYWHFAQTSLYVRTNESIPVRKAANHFLQIAHLVDMIILLFNNNELLLLFL